MIIYQVYPRSFSDGNNDGLGDLKGLLARLPYLASLGVEAIWISPFFKSPMKDFGYDVSDYCAVDPMFGSMEDFDRILEKATSLGMKIMVDMVLSHSSDQHPWFKESRSSKTNPKADWYVWADAKPDGSPPNNWMSLFGGSAWQWDTGRNQYYLHNFLRQQPDFNFHELQVQTALLEACEFWLKKGVRGFRLDVCNFYFHHESLKDNPPRPKDSKNTEGVHAGNPYNFQVHLYDKDQDENVSFLKKLRALTDKYPGSVLMGEVVSDDSFGVMKKYINQGGPLHTAYNFSLFKHGFNGNEMAQVLSEFQSRLPEGSPSWALGNHDVPRFISRFRANDNWPQSAKCFLFFLFCLRGNLVMYQGDELGLDEVEIPFELMQDPFGIEFYPEFKGRDGCRTPMPWTNKRPAEKTWLPIPDSHLTRSVEQQEQDRNSILNFSRKLIAWRKNNPWLETAGLKVLHSSDDTLVIERAWDERKFIAAFSFSSETQKVSIPELPSKLVELPVFGFSSWILGASEFTLVKVEDT